MANMSPAEQRAIKRKLCCLEGEVATLRRMVERCCHDGPTPPPTSNIDGIPAFFAYNGPTGISMGPVAVGDIVLNVEVDVDTLFNGTPTIEVGTLLDPDLFVVAGEAYLGQVAKYVFQGSFYMSAATTLLVTFTPGGATQGSGRVNAMVQR